MANFPLPKGYQRMGAFPIDASTVFPTLALLQDYAMNNGTAYTGQVCTVAEGATVTVYKIEFDKSVSIVGAGGDADYGLF